MNLNQYWLFVIKVVAVIQQRTVDLEFCSFIHSVIWETRSESFVGWPTKSTTVWTSGIQSIKHEAKNNSGTNKNRQKKPDRLENEFIFNIVWMNDQNYRKFELLKPLQWIFGFQKFSNRFNFHRSCNCNSKTACTVQYSLVSECDKRQARITHDEWDSVYFGHDEGLTNVVFLYNASVVATDGINSLSKEEMIMLDVER